MDGTLLPWRASLGLFVMVVLPRPPIRGLPKPTQDSREATSPESRLDSGGASQATSGISTGNDRQELPLADEFGSGTAALPAIPVMPAEAGRFHAATGVVDLCRIPPVALARFHAESEFLSSAMLGGVDAVARVRLSLSRADAIRVAQALKRAGYTDLVGVFEQGLVGIHVGEGAVLLAQFLLLVVEANEDSVPAFHVRDAYAACGTTANAIRQRLHTLATEGRWVTRTIRQGFWAVIRADLDEIREVATAGRSRFGWMRSSSRPGVLAAEVEPSKLKHLVGTAEEIAERLLSPLPSRVASADIAVKIPADLLSANQRKRLSARRKSVIWSDPVPLPPQSPPVLRRRVAK